jgi:hypothetical protein
MLVWSTQFPILPNRTADDLLRLCQKWLIGSPHSEWIDAEVPPIPNDDIVAISKNSHCIAIAKIRIGSEVYSGFRHQWQDEDRRDWATEIIGWHSANRFLVGIHLHCSTADTGIPLPRPKKPYIVKQILEEMGGDIDGDFPVCDEPRGLAESEIDTAVRLMLGETDHYLTVIYASSTWKNSPPFDSQKLAKWSAGMAHVVVEPSRQFSLVLANRVGRINPYQGAVSIFWPRGSGRATRFFPYEYRDEIKYASDVANTVRKALAGRRPDFHCTWDYLRELIARQKIEVLRQDGKTHLEEYICAFDEELKLTKKRLEDAEDEIGRLKTELVDRSRGSQIYRDGLLAFGAEQDLFPGEHKDVVARALKIAFDHVQPDGRLRDVLESLIKANPPTGESGKIEEEIKSILGNCTDAGKRERRALEDLGFSITEEGRHLKLMFRGDDRYTFAMSKTGSDWRGMKNWVSDVTKRLFK